MRVPSLFRVLGIAASAALAAVVTLSPYAATRAPLSPNTPAGHLEPEPAAVEFLEPRLARTGSDAKLDPEGRRPVREDTEPIRLHVSVRERATGEPIAATVDVWLLDQPETDERTAGDVQLTSLAVPESGRWSDEIPAGTYRLICLDQVASSADPEPFFVDRPTRIALDVDLPHDVVAELALFDEQGRELSEADLSREPHSIASSARRSVGPGWEKSLEVSIFFCGFTPPRIEPRTRLPLELPSRELPIGGGPATELRARIPDTSDAYGGPVRIQDLVSRSRNTETDATGARIRYVGVVLPEGFFDDCVRLPDGRRAVDVDSLFAGGAFIDFHAEALPAHRGSWRDVPIRVTATGLAYETLDFTYRLRDGRPQTHRLVPRERKRPLGLGDPASNDR